MPFDRAQKEKYAVITVDEVRLDASVAEAFKIALLGYIDDGDKEIIVDLSTVRFLDSTGLGAMVAGLKQLNGGGSFTLAGAQPAVMDLLSLTSMDRLFTLANSVDDAIAGG